MLKLDYQVNTVFIMLGSSCNLNCKYCMQHSLIEEKIPKRQLNLDIIDFITKQSLCYSEPIDVRFYGGEPLLYIEDIKEVVANLKKSGANVRYSIITNGKLLNDSIVNFFNDNLFEVAISWDGKNVIDTRMYDVVREHENELLNIKNLYIDGVLSAYNYKYDFLKANIPLQNKYFEKHGRFYKTFTDEIMDCSGNLRDLTKIDFDEVRKQNKQIIDYAMQHDITDPLGYMCFSQLFINIWMQQSVLEAKRFNYFCFCSNAVHTLNIDLDGNLYQCHNNWKKIGNIYEDNCDTYAKKSSINENICRANYNNECKTCPANAICLSGCPLISKEKRKETGYCELKKASFEQFIDITKNMMESPEKFTMLS